MKKTFDQFKAELDARGLSVDVYKICAKHSIMLTELHSKGRSQSVTFARRALYALLSGRMWSPQQIADLTGADQSSVRYLLSNPRPHTRWSNSILYRRILSALEECTSYSLDDKTDRERTAAILAAALERA